MVPNPGHLVSCGWESVLCSLAESRIDRCLEIGCDSTGANVILCGGSRSKHKLALHESVVRSSTGLFKLLGDSDPDSLRDQFGNIVFLLPDVNIRTLRALSELIYTGKTNVDSEEGSREISALLAGHIQVSGTITQAQWTTFEFGGLSLSVTVYFPADDEVTSKVK